MAAGSLRTMKEVAGQLARPPHRIIHLCEQGVVRPQVDARGRGSVRQFSREDVYRIKLALWLQEAGLQIPTIKPLMAALDRLMHLQEVRETEAGCLGQADLVELLRRIGSAEKPVLACFTPPDRVEFVTPGLSTASRPDVPVELDGSERHIGRHGVSIVVNLTMVAAGVP